MEQQHHVSPPALPAQPPTLPLAPRADSPIAMVTADDRNMGMLCHLLGIFTGFLGPLILWLVKKDESKFVNYHGREALNFHITVFLVSMASIFVIIPLSIVGIGFLLMPILFVIPILALIVEIMACVAANRGEWYRYPFCLRLI